MSELILIIEKDDIKNKVAQIARRISSDYQDQEPILSGVLKGAFIFLSDLVRHLNIPVKIDFLCHLASEGFFVGYGLDYNECHRESPEIYHLKS